MNKKLVKTLLAFVLATTSLFAAEKSQFGYVNVSDAVLLHPTMLYFNSAAKRFSLEALKGIDVSKRSEEDRNKYHANKKSLEEEIEKLEKARVDLDNNYLSDVKKSIISEENFKNLSESEKNKYNEKKGSLDSKYYDDADELRTKLYTAKQKLENLKSDSLYAGMTTSGETDKLFTLILDDVYDAMTAVADHYKVDFVFNSSAEIAYIESRITIDNPMGNFFANFDQDVQDRDGKVVMGAALTSWLGEKNSAFRHCSDRRMSAFVMKGGLNMTPAVIDYIYQKHKVGKDQRDFVLEYFEKIVNKEDN